MFKKRREGGFGGFKGGGRKFGGRDSFGGGDRGERPEMHQATCAECGDTCEVPFRPVDGRPVFCSHCFKKQGDGNERGFRDEGRGDFKPRKSFGDRPSFGDKRMFSAVCDACKNACEVPFRPTGERPVYCSDCFGKNSEGGKGKSFGNAGADNKVAEQLKAINMKLDTIMKTLSPSIADKIIAKIEKADFEPAKKVEKKVEVSDIDLGDKKVEKKAEKKAKKESKKKK